MLVADERREIDWSTAEVQQGAVVLALSGSAAKGWNERFEAVASLIGQGNTEWGEVSLTKKTIKVADVRAGAEDDLRHFLESVIAQVNSEVAPEPDKQTSEPEDPQAARDASMADKLRSFAAQDDAD